MRKQILHKRLLFSPLSLGMVILLLFTLLFWDPATAAVKSTLIKVGRYWANASDGGGNVSADFTSGWFPADINAIGNNMRWGECYTGGNIFLAASNYNYQGETVPYSLFVPSPPDKPEGDNVEPLQSYTRYGYKQSYVNFEDVTLDWYGDIDASKMIGNSDQTVTYTTRYENGVELSRKVVAFSNQYHDDYIITELDFTHKGDQTLNDFVIFMWQQESGTQRANGRNPSPDDNEGWIDQTEWLHYYGAKPGDSLRIFYQYMADDPRTSGDMMGGPVVSQKGRMIETGFEWWAILHASEAPFSGAADNSVNDPLQPKVTFTMTSQNLPIDDPSGYPNDPLGEKYQKYLQGYFGKEGALKMEGNYEGTYHRMNTDEYGSPDCYAMGVGHSHDGAFPRRYVVFGPYTFEPGQSLHIAYASGESGIGIEKMKEVGNGWYNQTLEAPEDLPNDETGYFPDNFKFPNGANQFDINKDLWISTGIDSLHKAAYEAQWNYDHKYMVPMSPPPPSVTITGYPEYAEVKWSDAEAEQMENFAGYRIMRKISNQDTTFYDVAYTTDGSDGTNGEHIFQDTSVLPGASYYYYVQAGVRVSENDMNASPRERGNIIWSGRVYNPTTQWIDPPRRSQDDLSKIRIVPNPYNINDPALLTYGWTDQRGIIFFNLPPKVTIKICTEFGDLVQTIEHDSPVLAGSTRWDMLTSSQQVIASGVYIVIFEKPDGELSYQKLVVVR